MLWWWRSWIPLLFLLSYLLLHDPCRFLPLSRTFNMSYEEAAVNADSAKKKKNLFFHKAAHNRHSWERVKQTCHPSDKDCDSLILEEGRQCPNGSKWRGCSSSENTEQKTGYSSPLGDLLGRLCGIRLLFIGIFTHCRNCSVSCYLARH